MVRFSASHTSAALLLVLHNAYCVSGTGFGRGGLPATVTDVLRRGGLKDCIAGHLEYGNKKKDEDELHAFRKLSSATRRSRVTAAQVADAIDEKHFNEADFRAALEGSQTGRIPARFVRSLPQGGSPEVLTAALKRGWIGWTLLWDVRTFAAICGEAEDGGVVVVGAEEIRSPRADCPAEVIAAGIHVGLRGLTWEHIVANPSWLRSGLVLDECMGHRIVDRKYTTAGGVVMTESINFEPLMSNLKVVPKGHHGYAHLSPEEKLKELFERWQHVPEELRTERRTAEAVKLGCFDHEELWQREFRRPESKSRTPKVIAAALKRRLYHRGWPADDRPGVLTLEQWNQLPENVRFHEEVLQAAFTPQSTNHQLLSWADFCGDERVGGNPGVVKAVVKNTWPTPVIGRQEWLQLPAHVKRDRDVVLAVLRHRDEDLLSAEWGRDWDKREDYPEELREDVEVVAQAIRSGVLKEQRQFEQLPQRVRDCPEVRIEFPMFN